MIAQIVLLRAASVRSHVSQSLTYLLVSSDTVVHEQNLFTALFVQS